MSEISLGEPAPLTWIENFVGVLIAPRHTMHHLAKLNDAQLTGFGGAALAVIIPTGLDGLRMSPPHNLAMMWLNVPFSILMGLSLWVVLAGLFSLTAWIFGAPLARTRRAFVLTGWSFVPWVFMAPVYCYRELLGFWFAPLAVVPFAWMFILQMIAVKEAFELKSVQMLLLFFGVPVLYMILQVLQFVQGFYVSITSVL